MPDAYDAPLLMPGQNVVGVTGTTVQIGGNNLAPITIWHRPKLPVLPLTRTDLAPACDPQWAHTPTPTNAAALLAEHGLAVIFGEPGTGRRTSAIRALTTALTPASDGRPPELFDLLIDWDDEESPLSPQVLPEPRRGTGYLVEASAAALSAAGARTLVCWAEDLLRAGAGLVVTADRNGWPTDHRFACPALAPQPVQVAVRRLEAANFPVQAGWLSREPSHLEGRFLMRGNGPFDPTAGVFEGLIGPGVSPLDAATIADRLAKIPADRVARAVEQCNNSKDDSGTEPLHAIRDEVLLWTGFVEDVLTDSGTRGADRILLLAAAYLDGAPVELCLKVAAAFEGRGPAAPSRLRQGRSPRRRLGDVGVDVSEYDTIAFRRMPGLAQAAIATDWHHWSGEREATRAWLREITAASGTAAAYTDQVGRRLLELSRTKVAEPPFFPLVETWAQMPGRSETVANLLTQAASTTELARETRTKLLDWAKKTNRPVREVVARVCAGTFGQRLPATALVRMRHILAHDDEATAIATAALVSYAARDAQARALVLETVQDWQDRYYEHPAAARAFLALADTAPPDSITAALVVDAAADPRTRDFLVSGWCFALQQHEVRERTHQVLTGWAHAVHDGRLEAATAFAILQEARDAHTPLDAMSRFLYGTPDHDEPAVIEARYQLANLPSARPTICSNLECPATGESEPASTTTIESAP